MNYFKTYANYKDLWFKILSTLVSIKTWLIIFICVCFFMDKMSELVYTLLLSGILGMKELQEYATKVLIEKFKKPSGTVPLQPNENA